MAKFKVGDRARFIYNRVLSMPHINDKGIPVGTEVTITTIGSGIGKYGLPFDCSVRYSGQDYTVTFDQLEPIIDLGSWDELQKTINWNPTKEANHAE